MPTPADTPDEVLIRKAVQGDIEAYGDLYERYLPQVYRYMFFRVRNPGEAEDLTEIVFLKVWETISRFQPGRVPFYAWIFRVARNLVIDYFRIRREEQPVWEELDLLEKVDSPEERVMALQQRERIFTTLATLKQEYQEVITLRFYGGFNYRTVAEILGKNEGAVRVLQYRALRALLQEVKKQT